jgi:hypothetical protein
MERLLCKFSKNDDVESISNNTNNKYCKYYSKWQWKDSGLKINWNNNFKKIHYFILANTQENYKYAGRLLGRE